MMNAIKRAVNFAAPGLMFAFREHRQRRYSAVADTRTPAEIFTDIYRNNVWGGAEGEFYSGNGSEDAVTAAYVAVVKAYIAEHGVRSVVDLGCGDFRVGAQIVEPDLSYVGVDVVADLVASNQQRFGRDGVRFEQCDIINGDLPDGDLLILRQVLQHLSNDQIASVLAKLRGRKHVLIAEHHPAPRRFRSHNHDKPAGHGIRVGFGSGVYPNQPPFSEPCRVLAQTPVTPVVAPGEMVTIYALDSGPRSAG